MNKVWKNILTLLQHLHKMLFKYNTIDSLYININYTPSWEQLKQIVIFVLVVRTYFMVALNDDKTQTYYKTNFTSIKQSVASK